jgi:predicted nucleic acid-binding protein
MQFIDTNIFIRHFTKDDAVKARACLALFQEAQKGKVTITTSETIIAEVVFVLSSKKLYALDRATIQALLFPLLMIRGLKLQYKRTLIHALELYCQYNVDFEDALAVAHMERQGITTLFSYDRGFDDMKMVKRREP